jgi:hypothetical protein
VDSHSFFQRCCASGSSACRFIAIIIIIFVSPGSKCVFMGCCWLGLSSFILLFASKLHKYLMSKKELERCGAHNSVAAV